MFENINEKQEKFVLSLLKKHVWQTEMQLEKNVLGELERFALEESLKTAKELLIEIGE